MSNGKILVVYFSSGGVTAGVAEELAKALGADLHEIVPAVRYTDADLDWMDKKSRSTVEMNDSGSRPAIAPTDLNISGYDTILLGFPVWWYVEPRIVDTFLDSYDFTGKTMIPFATSGGSSIDKSEVSLKAHCPAAHWKHGKRLTRANAAAWAKSL